MFLWALVTSIFSKEELLATIARIAKTANGPRII